MRKTDYTDVSTRYDDNEIRKRIFRDEHLAERVAAAGGRPVAMLDLACGTGNYLAVQTREFAGAPVTWFGLDASEAMLARARTKLEGVELTLGRAEELPYEDGRFAFVASSFAFHHFEAKPKALDELARVLERGGVFRMVNVAPERMPGWWIYRVYPAAWFEDEERFWSTGRIAHELERRGFEVRLRVDFERYELRVAEALADAERREVSQLAILPDDLYASGVARLRARLAEDPAARCVTEIALVECIARKTGAPAPAPWP